MVFKSFVTFVLYFASSPVYSVSNSFFPHDVVSLASSKFMSIKSPIQYDYYDLPYCAKRKTKSTPSKNNLNEGLFVNTPLSTVSPYEIKIKEDACCITMCLKKLTWSEINLFKYAIDSDFKANFLLNDFPVSVVDNHGSLSSVSKGFPVGFVAAVPKGMERMNIPKLHFLNNHARIIIHFKEKEAEFVGVRIVAFEMIPLSIKHTYPRGEYRDDTTILGTCNCMPAWSPHHTDNFQPVEGAGEEVIFTYDVKWVRDENEPNWDMYLASSRQQQFSNIHLFSLVESLIIVLLLTGGVAAIMLRTVHHKDATGASNSELERLVETTDLGQREEEDMGQEEKEEETADERQEEGADIGWRAVRGDVFRPPATNPMLLSVFAGTGMQILVSTLCTLVFAACGLISPLTTSTLLATAVMFFALTGWLAGYVSARLYRQCNCQERNRNVILTAALYPGAMGAVYLLINILLALYGSSVSAILTTLLALLFLVGFISAPLVYVGSYFGFRKGAFVTAPERTGNTPHLVPAVADKVWYNRPAVRIALGGLLPFTVVSIELYYIMTAVWLHQPMNFNWSYLLLIFLLLLVTCAEVSILLCYSQLCNEDHRWWWRSFLASGSSGVYLFFFSFCLFFAKLEFQGFVSFLLYFSYMAMASLTFAVLTGTVGLLASLWFVCRIYGAESCRDAYNSDFENNVYQSRPRSELAMRFLYNKGNRW